jgi:CDP-6-deoxy-D-xylo-4-hexulose-3-dehydrase
VSASDRVPLNLPAAPLPKDPSQEREAELRAEILGKVEEIYRLRKARESFTPGVSKVNYAGRVFDEREMVAVVDSALDFWLTLGKQGDAFERKFAKTVGAKHAVLTNSGSSANLLAISALTSPSIPGHLVEGDEVITCAVAFPTTVNPILQNRLVPVFVDAVLGTYNLDVTKLEAALSPKTRAVVFAHTLGNPADLDVVAAFCEKHDLWLVEDCCDALGATFDGRQVGRFGDVATCSFYAAHHITMGEGGVVWCDDPAIETALLSFRDWGRACYCPTGEAHPLGKCRKRFSWEWDGMPAGYDHKYTYTHIGYNLKPLDLQAAMGIEQLDKLPAFVARRRHNFAALYEAVREYDDVLVLPQWSPKAEPSWFAFPLTVRPGAPFSRREIVAFLEDRKIETRLLFCGNLLKHPAYKAIPHRVVGGLPVADQVLESTFFLGVFPGMTDEKLAYMTGALRAFLASKRGG